MVFMGNMFDQTQHVSCEYHFLIFLGRILAVAMLSGEECLHEKAALQGNMVNAQIQAHMLAIIMHGQSSWR